MVWYVVSVDEDISPYAIKEIIFDIFVAYYAGCYLPHVQPALVNFVAELMLLFFKSEVEVLGEKQWGGWTVI